MDDKTPEKLGEILIVEEIITQDQLDSTLSIQKKHLKELIYVSIPKKFGEILISKEIITKKQLEDALLIKKRTGEKIGEILKKQGIITEEQIVSVLESQLDIKIVDLFNFSIEKEAAEMLPEELCRKYLVVGIQISAGYLLVAMKDPLNYFALEDIRLLIQLPIKQVIASEKEITHFIDKFFSKKLAEVAINDFIKQKHIEVLKTTPKKKIEKPEDIDSAPIVKFINSIIENAIRDNVSDIHIEPQEDDIEIRVRIDGILQKNIELDTEALSSITSRIKIMANMDIGEKRIPQDGRIEYSVGNKAIDLRVSSLPTIYGEKIVMRLLDKSNFMFSNEKLGLSENDLKKYKRMISKPYGILFVTGPTGSGKTSTLYTMLSELNDHRRNIITLEDPVEYKMKGLNQVQVNSKAGITFATGLRAILRQDPDIIMIGEIRDGETAEIAVRAALTGHLVLSTLHTNDAPSAISRIIDMGINPFLISSSTIGVIAQRLVRKICTKCIARYPIDDAYNEVFGISSTNKRYMYKGAGCEQCFGSGYKGRVAIFEIMEVDKRIKLLINKGVTTDELRDKAFAGGMMNLADSCRKLVFNGVTTIEELLRVTYGF